VIAVKADRNHLTADLSASGAHTVIKRNATTNKITNYETYRPQTNPKDPKAWEFVKRFDGSSVGSKRREFHHNKFSIEDIYEPHVHDPFCEGGVRAPKQWEKPFGYE
jgi:hypothetical protein